MFSGIQSLIFGKKHKHKHEDSAEEQSQASMEGDFEILERRHSDEYDKNLYPNLDPSRPSSNLPYAISPSLPNLKDATQGSSNSKDEIKVDMLQGVPFELSSQLLLLDENFNTNNSLGRIMRQLNKIKDLGEDELFEDYSYDYELEHSVSSEYSES